MNDTFLIYTFSCLNGGTLADILTGNSVKAFVGYDGDANCPLGIDDFTTSIVMYFLSSFLSGKTVNEAKDVLEEAFKGEDEDGNKGTTDDGDQSVCD